MDEELDNLLSMYNIDIPANEGASANLGLSSIDLDATLNNIRSSSASNTLGRETKANVNKDALKFAEGRSGISGDINQQLDGDDGFIDQTWKTLFNTGNEMVTGTILGGLDFIDIGRNFWDAATSDESFTDRFAKNASNPSFRSNLAVLTQKVKEKMTLPVYDSQESWWGNNAMGDFSNAVWDGIHSGAVGAAVASLVPSVLPAKLVMKLSSLVSRSLRVGKNIEQARNLTNVGRAGAAASQFSRTDRIIGSAVGAFTGNAWESYVGAQQKGKEEYNRLRELGYSTEEIKEKLKDPTKSYFLNNSVNAALDAFGIYSLLKIPGSSRRGIDTPSIKRTLATETAPEGIQEFVNEAAGKQFDSNLSSDLYGIKAKDSFLSTLASSMTDSDAWASAALGSLSSVGFVAGGNIMAGKGILSGDTKKDQKQREKLKEFTERIDSATTELHELTKQDLSSLEGLRKMKETAAKFGLTEIYEQAAQQETFAQGGIHMRLGTFGNFMDMLDKTKEMLEFYSNPENSKQKGEIEKDTNEAKTESFLVFKEALEQKRQQEQEAAQQEAEAGSGPQAQAEPQEQKVEQLIPENADQLIEIYLNNKNAEPDAIPQNIKETLDLIKSNDQLKQYLDLYEQGQQELQDLDSEESQKEAEEALTRLTKTKDLLLKQEKNYNRALEVYGIQNQQDALEFSKVATNYDIVNKKIGSQITDDLDNFITDRIVEDLIPVEQQEQVQEKYNKKLVAPIQNWIDNLPVGTPITSGINQTVTLTEEDKAAIDKKFKEKLKNPETGQESYDFVDQMRNGTAFTEAEMPSVPELNEEDAAENPNAGLNLNQKLEKILQEVYLGEYGTDDTKLSPAIYELEKDDTEIARIISEKKSAEANKKLTLETVANLTQLIAELQTSTSEEVIDPESKDYAKILSEQFKGLENIDELKTIFSLVKQREALKKEGKAIQSGEKRKKIEELKALENSNKPEDKKKKRAAVLNRNVEAAIRDNQMLSLIMRDGVFQVMDFDTAQDDEQYKIQLEKADSEIDALLAANRTGNLRLDHAAMEHLEGRTYTVPKQLNADTEIENTYLDKVYVPGESKEVAFQKAKDHLLQEEYAEIFKDASTDIIENNARYLVLAGKTQTAKDQIKIQDTPQGISIGVDNETPVQVRGGVQYTPKSDKQVKFDFVTEPLVKSTAQVQAANKEAKDNPQSLNFDGESVLESSILDAEATLTDKGFGFNLAERKVIQEQITKGNAALEVLRNRKAKQQENLSLRNEEGYNQFKQTLKKAFKRSTNKDLEGESYLGFLEQFSKEDNPEAVSNSNVDEDTFIETLLEYSTPKYAKNTAAIRIAIKKFRATKNLDQLVKDLNTTSFGDFDIFGGKPFSEMSPDGKNKVANSFKEIYQNLYGEQLDVTGQNLFETIADKINENKEVKLYNEYKKAAKVAKEQGLNLIEAELQALIEMNPSMGTVQSFMNEVNSAKTDDDLDEMLERMDIQLPTKEQMVAMRNYMVHLLNNKEGEFDVSSITGLAGTGKTFFIGKIAPAIYKAVTGNPVAQVTGIAKGDRAMNNITSALGEPDTTSWFNAKDVENYTKNQVVNPSFINHLKDKNLVIVDEIGKLSLQELDYLDAALAQAKLESNDSKGFEQSILFTGDPLQTTGKANNHNTEFSKRQPAYEQPSIKKSGYNNRLIQANNQIAQLTESLRTGDSRIIGLQDAVQTTITGEAGGLGFLLETVQENSPGLLSVDTENNKGVNIVKSRTALVQDIRRVGDPENSLVIVNSERLKDYYNSQGIEALTAEEAQGAEAENVFVDFVDVREGQNELESTLEEFYTALSRAKDYITINTESLTGAEQIDSKQINLGKDSGAKNALIKNHYNNVKRSYVKTLKEEYKDSNTYDENINKKEATPENEGSTGNDTGYTEKGYETIDDGGGKKEQGKNNGLDSNSDINKKDDIDDGNIPKPKGGTEITYATNRRGIALVNSAQSEDDLSFYIVNLDRKNSDKSGFYLFASDNKRGVLAEVAWLRPDQIGSARMSAPIGKEPDTVTQDDLLDSTQVTLTNASFNSRSVRYSQKLASPSNVDNLKTTLINKFKEQFETAHQTITQLTANFIVVNEDVRKKHENDLSDFSLLLGRTYLKITYEQSGQQKEFFMPVAAKTYAEYAGESSEPNPINVVNQAAKTAKELNRAVQQLFTKVFPNVPVENQPKFGGELAVPLLVKNGSTTAPKVVNNTQHELFMKIVDHINHTFFEGGRQEENLEEVIDFVSNLSKEDVSAYEEIFKSYTQLWQFDATKKTGINIPRTADRNDSGDTYLLDPDIPSSEYGVELYEYDSKTEPVRNTREYIKLSEGRQVAIDKLKSGGINVLPFAHGADVSSQDLISFLESMPDELFNSGGVLVVKNNGGAIQYSLRTAANLTVPVVSKSTNELKLHAFGEVVLYNDGQTIRAKNVANVKVFASSGEKRSYDRKSKNLVTRFNVSAPNGLMTTSDLAEAFKTKYGASKNRRTRGTAQSAMNQLALSNNKITLDHNGRQIEVGFRKQVLINNKKVTTATNIHTESNIEAIDSETKETVGDFGLAELMEAFEDESLDNAKSQLRWNLEAFKVGAANANNSDYLNRVKTNVESIEPTNLQYDGIENAKGTPLVSPEESSESQSIETYITEIPNEEETDLEDEDDDFVSTYDEAISGKPTEGDQVAAQEALSYVQQFLPDVTQEELNAVSRISTADNRTVYGYVKSGIITALKNAKGFIHGEVLRHEIFHKFYEQYLTAAEKYILENKVRATRSYQAFLTEGGLKDNAYNYNEYLATRFQKHKKRKTNSFIARRLNDLQDVYNFFVRRTEYDLQKMFNGLYEGKFTTRHIPNNLTSAKPQFISEITTRLFPHRKGEIYSYTDMTNSRNFFKNIVLSAMHTKVYEQVDAKGRKIIVKDRRINRLEKIALAAKSPTRVKLDTEMLLRLELGKVIGKLKEIAEKNDEGLNNLIGRLQTLSMNLGRSPKDRLNYSNNYIQNTVELVEQISVGIANLIDFENNAGINKLISDNNLIAKGIKQAREIKLEDDSPVLDPETGLLEENTENNNADRLQQRVNIIKNMLTPLVYLSGKKDVMPKLYDTIIPSKKRGDLNVGEFYVEENQQESQSGQFQSTVEDEASKATMDSEIENNDKINRELNLNARIKQFLAFIPDGTQKSYLDFGYSFVRTIKTFYENPQLRLTNLRKGLKTLQAIGSDLMKTKSTSGQNHFRVIEHLADTYRGAVEFLDSSEKFINNINSTIKNNLNNNNISLFSITNLDGVINFKYQIKDDNGRIRGYEQINVKETGKSKLTLDEFNINLDSSQYLGIPVEKDVAEAFRKLTQRTLDKYLTEEQKQDKDLDILKDIKNSEIYALGVNAYALDTVKKIIHEIGSMSSLHAGVITERLQELVESDVPVTAEDGKILQSLSYRISATAPASKADTNRNLLIEGIAIDIARGRSINEILSKRYVENIEMSKSNELRYQENKKEIVEAIYKQFASMVRNYKKNKRANPTAAISEYIRENYNSMVNDMIESRLIKNDDLQRAQSSIDPKGNHRYENVLGSWAFRTIDSFIAKVEDALPSAFLNSNHVSDNNVLVKAAKKIAGFEFAEILDRKTFQGLNQISGYDKFYDVNNYSPKEFDKIRFLGSFLNQVAHSRNKKPKYYQFTTTHSNRKIDMAVQFNVPNKHHLYKIIGELKNLENAREKAAESMHMDRFSENAKTKFFQESPDALINSLMKEGVEDFFNDYIKNVYPSDILPDANSIPYAVKNANKNIFGADGLYSDKEKARLVKIAKTHVNSMSTSGDKNYDLLMALAENIAPLYAVFAVTDYFMSNQLHQVIAGDIAFSKNPSDADKRMQKSASPGKTMLLGIQGGMPKRSRGIFLVDNVRNKSSENDPRELYSSILGIPYEPEDSIVFATPEYFERVRNSAGDSQIKLMTKDIRAGVDFKGRSIYSKRVTVELTDRLVNAHPELRDLREMMEKNDIMEAMMASATKEYIPNEKNMVDIYDIKNATIEDKELKDQKDTKNPINVFEMDNELLSIQSNPVHEEQTIAEFSQFAYHINSNGKNQAEANEVYELMGDIMESQEKENDLKEDKVISRINEVSKTEPSEERNALLKALKKAHIRKLAKTIGEESASLKDKIMKSGAVDFPLFINRYTIQIANNLFKSNSKIRNSGFKFVQQPSTALKVINIGGVVKTYDELSKEEQKFLDANFYNQDGTTREVLATLEDTFTDILIKYKDKKNQWELAKNEFQNGMYQNIASLSVFKQRQEIEGKTYSDQETKTVIDNIKEVYDRRLAVEDSTGFPRRLKMRNENNAAEVIISPDHIRKMFLGENGRPITQKELNDKIQELKEGKDPRMSFFGVRIPSTGIHSAMAMQIVGVNAEMNRAYVPEEIVALHGSDFDVDALFSVRYEFVTPTDIALYKKMGVRIDEGDVPGITITQNYNPKETNTSTEGLKSIAQAISKREKVLGDIVSYANRNLIANPNKVTKLTDGTKVDYKSVKNELLKLYELEQKALKNVKTSNYFKIVTLDKNQDTMNLPITFDPIKRSFLENIKLSDFENDRAAALNKAINKMSAPLESKEALRKILLENADKIIISDDSVGFYIPNEVKREILEIDKEGKIKLGVGGKLRILYGKQSLDVRGGFFDYFKHRTKQQYYKANNEGVKGTGIEANIMKTVRYNLANAQNNNNVFGVPISEDSPLKKLKTINVDNPSGRIIKSFIQKTAQAVKGQDDVINMFIPLNAGNEFIKLISESGYYSNGELRIPIEDNNVEPAVRLLEQMYDLQNDAFHKIEYNGTKLDALTGKTVKKGEKGIFKKEGTADEISDSILNGYIDNVKEQITTLLNASGKTIRAIGMAIYYGLDVDTVGLVFQQPIITSINNSNFSTDSAIANTKKQLLEAINEFNKNKKEKIKKSGEASFTESDFIDYFLDAGDYAFAFQDNFEAAYEKIKKTNDQKIIKSFLESQYKSVSLLEKFNDIGKSATDMSTAYALLGTTPITYPDMLELDDSLSGIEEGKNNIFVPNFTTTLPHFKRVIDNFRGTMETISNNVSTYSKEFFNTVDGIRNELNINLSKEKYGNKKIQTNTAIHDEFTRFIMSGWAQKMLDQEQLDIVAVDTYGDLYTEKQIADNKKFLKNDPDKLAKFIQSIQYLNKEALWKEKFLKNLQDKLIELNAGTNGKKKPNRFLDFFSVTSYKTKDDMRKLVFSAGSNLKPIDEKNLIEGFLNLVHIDKKNPAVGAKLQRDFIIYSILNDKAAFGFKSYTKYLPEESSTVIGANGEEIVIPGLLDVISDYQDTVSDNYINNLYNDQKEKITELFKVQLLSRNPESQKTNLYYKTTTVQEADVDSSQENVKKKVDEEQEEDTSVTTVEYSSRFKRPGGFFTRIAGNSQLENIIDNLLKGELQISDLILNSDNYLIYEDATADESSRIPIEDLPKYVVRQNDASSVYVKIKGESGIALYKKVYSSPNSIGYNFRTNTDLELINPKVSGTFVPSGNNVNRIDSLPGGESIEYNNILFLGEDHKDMFNEGEVVEYTTEVVSASSKTYKSNVAKEITSVTKEEDDKGNTIHKVKVKTTITKDENAAKFQKISEAKADNAAIILVADELRKNTGIDYVTDSAEFERIVNEIDPTVTPDNYPAGFAYNGKVYLNTTGRGNQMGIDTPLHEYAHFYLKTIKKNNPKLYRQLIKHLKKTRPDIIEKIENSSFYSQMSRPDQLEESLAQAIGEEIKNYTPTTDNVFRKLVREVVNFAKKLLGIYTIRNAALDLLTDKFEMDVTDDGKVNYQFESLAERIKNVANQKFRPLATGVKSPFKDRTGQQRANLELNQVSKLGDDAAAFYEKLGDSSKKYMSTGTLIASLDPREAGKMQRTLDQEARMNVKRRFDNARKPAEGSAFEAEVLDYKNRRQSLIDAGKGGHTLLEVMGLNHDITNADINRVAEKYSQTVPIQYFEEISNKIRRYFNENVQNLGIEGSKIINESSMFIDLPFTTTDENGNEIQLAGVAGTPDMVLQNESGVYTVIDLKTGSLRGSNNRVFPDTKIAMSSLNKAKLQITTYMLMVKAKDPNAVFANDMILHANPNDSNISVIKFHELSTYLEILKNNLDSNFVAQNPDLFNSSSYYQLEGMASLTPTKRQEFTTNVQTAVADEVMVHSVNKKKFKEMRNLDRYHDSLGSMIFSIIGVDPIKTGQIRENLPTFLDSWWSTASSLSNKGLQAVGRLFQEKKQLIRKNMAKAYTKHDKLLLAVKKEDSSLFGGLKGKKYKESYSWMWNTNGGETDIVTWKDAKWDELSDAKKEYADYYRQQLRYNLFKAGNPRLGIEFIQEELDTRIDLTSETKKELKNQIEDLLNRPNINSFARLGQGNFIYWEGWTPRLRAQYEELMGKAAYLKQLRKDLLTEKDLDIPKNSITEDFLPVGLNLPMLGRSKISSKDQFDGELTYNTEILFKAFIRASEKKSELDSVYNLTIGLQQYFKNLDAQTNLTGKGEYNTAIRWLNGFMTTNLLNTVNGVWDKKRAIPIPKFISNRMQGDDKKFVINSSIDGFFMRMRSYYVHTALGFNVFSGIKSFASQTIIGLTKGLQGTISKTISGRRWMGSFVEDEENIKRGYDDYTVSDFFFGFAQTLKLMGQQTSAFLTPEGSKMRRDLENNKLYLMNRDFGNIPDQELYKTGLDETQFKTKRKFFGLVPPWMSFSLGFIVFQQSDVVTYSTLLAAQMRRRKFKNSEGEVSNFWDAYEAKDGELIWNGGVRGTDKKSGTTVSELTALEVSGMKEVIRRQSGNYREDERVAMEANVLGQFYMTFKKFFPAILGNAYEGMISGGVYENDTLGRYILTEDKLLEWRPRSVEGYYTTVAHSILHMANLMITRGKGGPTAVAEYYKNLSPFQKQNYTMAAMHIGSLVFMKMILLPFVFGSDIDDDERNKYLMYINSIIAEVATPINLKDILGEKYGNSGFLFSLPIMTRFADTLYSMEKLAFDGVIDGETYERGRNKDVIKGLPELMKNAYLINTIQNIQWIIDDFDVADEAIQKQIQQEITKSLNR